MRDKIMFAYNHYCQVEGCLNLATDLHHIKPNTKVNRKKFPLYLNSPFNLMPICQAHHVTNSKKIPKSPSDTVCQMYEDWLKERE